MLRPLARVRVVSKRSRRPQEESYVLTYNDFGEAEGSARSQAED